jgi:hypothetical protein
MARDLQLRTGTMICVRSSVYPEPQTFNEWQQHLHQERMRIFNEKLGRESFVTKKQKP